MHIRHCSSMLTYMKNKDTSLFLLSRKMEMKHQFCCMIFLSITLTVTSASSFSSGGRDEMFHSTGRSILQVIEECPVNIEALNYSNLTSQCKRPYQVQPCCDAFAGIACPYAEQLNNSRNDCATTLFKYLGFLHYENGLFANLCSKTKDGLPCPEPVAKVDASAGRRLSSPSRQLMIFTATFILLLLGVLGS